MDQTMRFTEFTYDSNTYLTNNGGNLPIRVVDLLLQKEKKDRYTFAAKMARGIFSISNASSSNWKTFETELGLKISVATITKMKITGVQDVLSISLAHAESQDFELNDFTADVYVFYDMNDSPEKQDPKELSHWNFYVTEAAILKDYIKSYKTLSAKNINKLVAVRSNFERLKSAIYSVAHTLQLN